MPNYASIKIKFDVHVELLKLKKRLRVKDISSVLRHLIEEHELYHQIKRNKLY
ncbi:MAG: hypothetical protein NDF54_02360 [archaeon GB-1867-035]|nr:hypothetical protein [Candidatus Culexmicrobium profundum]